MYPCFTVIEGVPNQVEMTQPTFGGAMLKDGQLLDELPDLTIRREDVEHIVQKLNQNGVSEVHFREILYDWITEQSML